MVKQKKTPRETPERLPTLVVSRRPAPLARRGRRERLDVRRSACFSTRASIAAVFATDKRNNNSRWWSVQPSRSSWCARIIDCSISVKFRLWLGASRIPGGLHCRQPDRWTSLTRRSIRLPGVCFGRFATWAGPDGVEPRHHFAAQLDLQRVQAAGELLHRARSDDRRADYWIVQ
jgi:hypothetical protein